MSVRGIAAWNHVEGKSHVRVHLLSPSGASLCGDPPVRLVPCEHCMRQVYVHIRAPWVQTIGEGKTVTVCGRPVHLPGGPVQAELAAPAAPGSAGPELPASSPAAGEAVLGADRAISAEEAAAWVESDHPDLWRLCWNCERVTAEALAKRERQASEAERLAALRAQEAQEREAAAAARLAAQAQKRAYVAGERASQRARRQAERDVRRKARERKGEAAQISPEAAQLAELDQVRR